MRARSSTARRACGAPRTGAATVTTSRRTAPSSRPTAPTRPAVTWCGSARPEQPTSPRRRTAPTVAARRGGDRACTGQYGHRLGRNEHGPRVHLRQRERPGGIGRLDAARLVGDERPAGSSPRSTSIRRTRTTRGSRTRVTTSTRRQPRPRVQVTRSGTATWTDRTYNLSDLPVTDLVRDDLTGDLYAATDFGVWTLPSGTTTLSLTGGLPMVEVPGLTIVPGARVVRGDARSGGWAMTLPSRLNLRGTKGRLGQPSYSAAPCRPATWGSSKLGVAASAHVSAAGQLHTGPSGEPPGDARPPFAPV